MACSKPSTDYLANEIRIALVGKVGAGKSSLGNTILGHKKFKSLPAGKSVTQFCEHASLERLGKNLQVVDVPGFRDTSSSKEKLHQKIMQCVALLSPGIHAILFVVRIGRYTEEDVKTVEDFIKLFGAPSKKFVIVIFTGEDDLDEDYTFQNYMEDADASLRKFLDDLNYRYISVNNRGNVQEKKRFVERLLEKIEKLIRDNKRSYYTCEMLDNAEKHLKKLEDKKAKAIEEKNKKKDEQRAAELLKKYIDKEMEEQTKFLENERANIRFQIDSLNHLEARLEAREEISETIKSMPNTPKEEKSNAGLYTAMGAGATAGAAAGALVGPIGAVIGGLAGATYGAFLSWLS